MAHFKFSLLLCSSSFILSEANLFSNDTNVNPSISVQVLINTAAQSPSASKFNPSAGGFLNSTGNLANPQFPNAVFPNVALPNLVNSHALPIFPFKSEDRIDGSLNAQHPAGLNSLLPKGIPSPVVYNPVPPADSNSILSNPTNVSLTPKKDSALSNASFGINHSNAKERESDE